MSGRLDILGALNRPRTLNPLIQSNCGEGPDIGSASSNSASSSYSKMERKLKTLTVENAKLRSELDDTRVTLKQLISENSHEKFDERRINLLKFQLIQLERQIAILNEALGSRHAAVLEVENTMTWLANKLRAYIAADVKGPMVHVARSDLTSMTKVLESARIKLFKALESSGKDTIGRDLVLLNPFLGGKCTPNEQVSLLDICLQRMDYINLRHVAQLESKLCRLYKELIRVHEHLQNMKPQAVFAGHVASAERDRVEAVLLGACIKLRDSADDLMALSLLCPSSPWPVLKRPIIKQVPVDRVISALPVLPHKKQEEVTRIIEAVVHTSNHHQFLQTKEIAVLKEELAFHRSVFDLQMQYTQALFDAVRKGYKEFEASARSLICKPLTDILGAYKHLKNSASEDAFRDFLLIMRTNEEQLASVVEALTAQDFEADESGSTAFSKFEEEFTSKINSLVQDCQTERDAALKGNKIVQTEKSKKDVELQQLIEDLENKHEKMWTAKSSVCSELIPAFEKEDTDKDRKHQEIPRENSAEASSHLVEAADSKNSEINSKSVKHKAVMVQQSMPNDSDEVLKCKSENETYKLKSKPGLSQEVVLENTTLGGYDGKKTKKVIWRPNQEWSNDFSGETKKDEELLNTATDDPEVNSCEKTKECSQITAHQSTIDKPRIKPRKSECTMKKPLSYETNLSVANRNLKLKCYGNVSKTDIVEGSVDSGVLRKSESYLELNKSLSSLNESAQQQSKCEEELTKNEKHKLWR